MVGGGGGGGGGTGDGGAVDSLAALLGATSLGEGAAPPTRLPADPPGTRLLFLDCANFAANLFRPSLELTMKIVAAFAAAAQHSGYTLEVFVDMSRGEEGDESRKKWKTRRQQEVINGEKRVPVSCGFFSLSLFFFFFFFRYGPIVLCLTFPCAAPAPLPACR